MMTSAYSDTTGSFSTVTSSVLLALEALSSELERVELDEVEEVMVTVSCTLPLVMET